jgi:hypothetical protein
MAIDIKVYMYYSWINREDIDFDNVETMEALQEWELVETLPNPNDIIEYPTRQVAESKVNMYYYFRLSKNRLFAKKFIRSLKM